MIPGIDTQIAAMRSAWPLLQVHRIDAQLARWRGPLRPLLRTYEVEVTYRAPTIIENIRPLRQQPLVRVLSPVLKQRRGHREGDLPHVYWDHPTRPALCLFDHETAEWTPFQLLAETTIPWSIDWLGCYEGWRATGEWTGGGRHVSPSPSEGALS